MIYIHKSNNQNIPPWLPLNIYVDFILIFILKDIMGYSGLASLKHSLKITKCYEVHCQNIPSLMTNVINVAI